MKNRVGNSSDMPKLAKHRCTLLFDRLSYGFPT
ncbi:Uncharacterised protein [Vibrio cholerae]|nr:Uncharacterised protein [Vibrio cholerae]